MHSKMTTDSFCEDAKLIVSSFVPEATSTYLSCLAFSLSVPAALFLPSVSLAHPIILELEVMGVPSEREKSAVTTFLENMTQGRVKEKSYNLSIDCLKDITPVS